ncbi:MAG: thioredoxin-disulfide reductase [Candidatus Aminicenantes bacterium]
MNGIFDVVIIGAGPAGLSAAVYAGRARLETLVLEKGLPGGQVLLADFIENYPGFPEGVKPSQLMENFRRHAQKFGAKMETDEAKQVQKKGRNWVVAGNKGEYRSRAVIVATGSVYRKLGLEKEASFTGRGVSYCATCDGAFFKNKDVVVVGGGDHALSEALFLTKFCRSVKVIHRRQKFRAEKILQERIMANEKIDVIWDSVVEDIGGGDKVEWIALRNVKTNTSSRLKLDGVFVSIGMDPNSSMVKDVVDLDKNGQIKVNFSMSTSQPGIFAAGDVTDACPQQIATAAATGVTASLSVNDYLENLK